MNRGILELVGGELFAPWREGEALSYLEGTLGG